MRPQERYVSRSRCQGPLGNLSAHATTQASYTVPQSCVCNIVTQLIAFQGPVLRADLHACGQRDRALMMYGAPMMIPFL